MELDAHRNLANELRSLNAELQSENAGLRLEVEKLRHRAELAEAMREPDLDSECLKKHNAKLREEVVRLQREERAASSSQSVHSAETNTTSLALQSRICELEKEVSALHGQLRVARNEIEGHDAEVERLEASLRKSCVCCFLVFYWLGFNDKCP